MVLLSQSPVYHKEQNLVGHLLSSVTQNDGENWFWQRDKSCLVFMYLIH